MVGLVSFFVWFLTGTTVFAGDTKNVGSASTLEGRVRLAVVFVSDGIRIGHLKSNAPQIRRLKRGTEWINAQAFTYNVSPVQFTHRIYGRFRDINNRTTCWYCSGNENVEMVHLISWCWVLTLQNSGVQSSRTSNL